MQQHMWECSKETGPLCCRRLLQELSRCGRISKETGPMQDAVLQGVAPRINHAAADVGFCRENAARRQAPC